MSKLSLKPKNRKPVQENQKISAFFKKQELNTPKKVEVLNSPLEIVDVDAVDEIPVRKTQVVQTGDILDDITNATKRKFDQIAPCNSCDKDKYFEEIPDFIVKSPPLKRTVTSNGNSSLRVINLSDLTKNEFEQIQNESCEQLLQESCNKNETTSSVSKSVTVEERKPKIFNSTFIQRTPEKSAVLRNDTGSSSDKKKSTAGSAKKSPHKLFARSPNLEHFKVHVMDKFVQISPSKRNKIVVLRDSPIKLVTPRSPLNSSIAAQKSNESTPIRTESPKKYIPSDTKSKMKLDFSPSPANNLPTSALSDKNKNSKQRIEEYSFDDSWDDNDLKNLVEEYKLDLSNSCHCILLEIDKTCEKRSSRILVKSSLNEDKAFCVLRDVWVYTRIEVGCNLRITAIKLEDEWVVTQKDGLLVFEPDFLVSATTVVGSMFCKRQTALKEKYFGFDANNKPMVVGNIVHELLQTALRTNANTVDKVQKVCADILNSREMLLTFYFTELDETEVRKEVQSFIPRVVTFIKDYMKCHRKLQSKSEPTNGNWRGTFDSIEDIEENIWCPELGLKGKVDITARTGSALMPLELKTGKATGSIEHQGQIMFYIMMMKKLGYKVPSGFLLYLREGKFQEILLKANDTCHLINIRNELVHYMTQKPKVQSSNKSIVGVEIPSMPDPINRIHSCMSCGFNVLCAAYLKGENRQVDYFNPLQEELLSHLKPKHIQYFVDWNNMIELENSDKVSRKFLWDIFKSAPEERERKGQCIINVRVTQCDPSDHGMFVQTFENMTTGAIVNFLASGIGENSYVVVSIDRRPAVASGLVSAIDFESISISLDRDLRAKYGDKMLYHIDTYDSQSSRMFLQSSLALILDDTPSAQRLRELVVECKPPVFSKIPPSEIPKSAKSILKRLDSSQMRAVVKALQTDSYVLIKGMPGTGKTATIVALIEVLVACQQTVLITSHTNLAVDNVCIRLIERKLPVLRLGSIGKTHEKLMMYSESVVTKNCRTTAEFDAIYSKAKVVAVTCIGSKHALLTKRKFDVCIVDESTQVMQPSVFRAFSSCTKYILVGDPDQLKPIVKSSEARSLGLSESLFERLQTREAVALLDLNYRMNSTITKLANKLTYQNLLKIGSEAVANATLILPAKQAFEEKYSKSKWILDILDTDLKNAVTLVDTGPVWNKETIAWKICAADNAQQVPDPMRSTQNPYETSVIVTLVYALLHAGVLPKHIGVIAPYVDQTTQLNSFLSSVRVDVSTVDRFQGQDKEVIFYSGTKSFSNKIKYMPNEFHILEDKRRLTVAVTRAKHKLVVVGDFETLTSYTPMANFFNSVHTENVYNLKSGHNGFSWETIVKLDDIKI